MSGRKLAAASEAVRRFCRRPQSTKTILGLVTFEGLAAVAVPVQPVVSATPAIGSVLDDVTATGGTALLDAVAVDAGELERAAGPGQLRAVVLLTDGQENSSRTTLSDAQTRLADAGAIVFAIAYGADADLPGLQVLAGTSGLAVTASEHDIKESTRRSQHMSNRASGIARLLTRPIAGMGDPPDPGGIRSSALTFSGATPVFRLPSVQGPMPIIQICARRGFCRHTRLSVPNRR